MLNKTFHYSSRALDTLVILPKIMQNWPKLLLDAGILIRDVKNLPPMSFGVSDKDSCYNRNDGMGKNGSESISQ
ncbi:MAG: hypothetical protein WAK17_05920 [Candidatus Nitrosopolaris sp.]